MFLESVPYEHRIIAQNREWGSANRPNILSQDDAGFATLTIVRMLQIGKWVYAVTLTLQVSALSNR
jgi:hypothetical protein